MLAAIGPSSAPGLDLRDSFTAPPKYHISRDNAVPPAARAASCLEPGDGCSDENPMDYEFPFGDHAGVPDIGAFSARNLSSLTPQQIQAIDKCESPDQAKEIIRRSRTPCSYFYNGSCKWGDRCSFYHAPIENEKTVSDESAIGIGDRVMISGLSGATELNGQQGVVVKLFKNSRCGVQLENDRSEKSIKTTNLLAIKSSVT